MFPLELCLSQAWAAFKPGPGLGAEHSEQLAIAASRDHHLTMSSCLLFFWAKLSKHWMVNSGVPVHPSPALLSVNARGESL